MHHKKSLTEQWQALKCELECAVDSLSSAKTPTSSSTGDIETTVHYIAAEINFFVELQERMEQGEIIPIDEATRDMYGKQQHNVEYCQDI